MKQRLFAKDLEAQKINLALTGRLGHDDLRSLLEVICLSQNLLSLARFDSSSLCQLVDTMYLPFQNVFKRSRDRGRLYQSIEKVTSCYMSGIKLQYCLLPFSLSLCIPLFHSFFSSCPPRNRLKLEGFR